MCVYLIVGAGAIVAAVKGWINWSEAEKEAEKANAAKRASKRDELKKKILTIQSGKVPGRRIGRQLGAVFSKWHYDEGDVLPGDYFGGTDPLTLHDLVDLTLRYKALELGANTVIGVKIRTFKNGCEGSGDAVQLE